MLQLDGSPLVPGSPSAYDIAMKRLVSALMLVSLCGCSTVVSTHPFGEAPLDLSTQADKWTGTWRTPAGPCAMTVQDATKGVLAMTSTTPKGRWRWSNDTQYVYLRSGGEWTYASIDCSEGTNTCFIWGKIVNEDGMILWWLPDPEKFKPLVESGALPGTIEKTNIRKKKSTTPSGLVIGYTGSGDPIYGLTSPSGVPVETFPLELELPSVDYPPETENLADENVAENITARGGPSTKQTMSEMFTGNEITMGDLKPEHYELIASPSNGVLFAWECPVVLVKESARSDLGYLRAAVKRWMRKMGK